MWWSVQLVEESRYNTDIHCLNDGCFHLQWLEECDCEYGALITFVFEAPKLRKVVCSRPGQVTLQLEPRSSPSYTLDQRSRGVIDVKIAYQP